VDTRTLTSTVSHPMGRSDGSRGPDLRSCGYQALTRELNGRSADRDNLSVRPEKACRAGGGSPPRQAAKLPYLERKN
jgi:hypothetical protein